MIGIPDPACKFLLAIFGLECINSRLAMGSRGRWGSDHGRKIENHSSGKEGSVERFGEIVKRLRQEKGWTIEDVARRIGTHKGYVCGIEKGNVNPPSAKLVIKLAKVLGGDENELLLRSVVEKVPCQIRGEVERRVFGGLLNTGGVVKGVERERREEAARKIRQGFEIICEAFGLVSGGELKSVLMPRRAKRTLGRGGERVEPGGARSTTRCSHRNQAAPR